MFDDKVVVKQALIILQHEFVILSSLGATRFLDIWASSHLFIFARCPASRKKKMQHEKKRKVTFRSDIRRTRSGKRKIRGWNVSEFLSKVNIIKVGYRLYPVSLSKLGELSILLHWIMVDPWFRTDHKEELHSFEVLSGLTKKTMTICKLNTVFR